MIDKERYFNDRDLKQNYLDVTDKDDKVSFIQPNRIPKDWDEEENPSLPYEIKGRNEVSIGKIVRAILKVLIDNGISPFADSAAEFKDKDIEEFVNNFKAMSVNTKLEFKIVDGSDIAKYYDNKKYYTEAGSLGGSCMAGESKKTFKLYTENPTKVKMLIYVDENDKIHGRALLWKLKKSPCEATHFMDRVYTNRDSDVLKFRMHADEKGWLQKKKMNSMTSENVHFVYKGKDVMGEIIVKLDGECRDYPFVDTLCFLSEDGKELSNCPSFNCDVLHSVSGDRESCSSCDGEIVFCDECIGSGKHDCYDCDGSGDTDSGKCVTCKGKGEVSCDHIDADLCDECCDGVVQLMAKKIECRLADKLDSKMKKKISSK